MYKCQQSANLLYLSQPLTLHYTLHSYALAAQYKLISKQEELVVLPDTGLDSAPGS